jgi:hypothetical protein
MIILNPKATKNSSKSEAVFGLLQSNEVGKVILLVEN